MDDICHKSNVPPRAWIYNLLHGNSLLCSTNKSTKWHANWRQSNHCRWLNSPMSQVKYLWQTWNQIAPQGKSILMIAWCEGSLPNKHFYTDQPTLWWLLLSLSNLFCRGKYVYCHCFYATDMFLISISELLHLKVCTFSFNLIKSYKNGWKTYFSRLTWLVSSWTVPSLGIFEALSGSFFILSMNSSRAFAPCRKNNKLKNNIKEIISRNCFLSALQNVFWCVYIHMYTVYWHNDTHSMHQCTICVLSLVEVWFVIMEHTWICVRDPGFWNLSHPTYQWQGSNLRHNSG